MGYAIILFSIYFAGGCGNSFVSYYNVSKLLEFTVLTILVLTEFLFDLNFEIP